MWHSQRSSVRSREVIDDEWLILVMDDESVLSDYISPTDSQHSVEPRDPMPSGCSERSEPRWKRTESNDGVIPAKAFQLQ